MSIVVKKAPETRLMLVGDGPERHIIERLIEELNLQNNVMLTGFTSDIPNLLRCSDVAVLCSETESAPLTLLESLSSGLPVVATRVGGIPEIIQDGINGFLVETKHPESIAEKLVLLNSDRKLRLRLGAAARRTIEKKYTAEKVVRQYEQIYESII